MFCKVFISLRGTINVIKDNINFAHEKISQNDLIYVKDIRIKDLKRSSILVY